MPTKKAAAKRAPAKKKTAELRVHGVGGSSPESILGLASVEEAELVAFGDRTSFWRRRKTQPSDYEIEGYCWGGLTSGSSLQPLWLLLLPFTLVNVAGWMHDPTLQEKWKPRWIRRVTSMVAFSLSLTYVLWAVSMLVDSAGSKWFPQQDLSLWDGTRLTARWGVVLGALLVLGILSALGVLATRAGKAGERPPTKQEMRAVRGALKARVRTADQDEFAALVATQTRADENVHAFFGVAAKKEESLTDPNFFARRRDSGRLLWWHVFVSAVAVVGLSLVAWVGATGDSVPDSSKRCDKHLCYERHQAKEPREDTDPRVYLQNAFGGLGVLQVVLVAALAALSFARDTDDEPKPDQRGRAYPGRPRRRFRWAGPAVASALGIMIANAMFAGASRAFDNRLGIDKGHTFLLADVMVMTVLFLVAAALIWGVRHRALRPDMGYVNDDEPERVPENSDQPGRPPAGATKSARKNTARFRGITSGITRLDAVLTATAIAFFLAAIVFAIGRQFHGRDWYRWEPLAVAGSQLIVLAGTALIGVLFVKRKDPKTRKTVGIIWDLLTFWPRRFHPFAVRPYSEQAVPELRGRIEQLLAEHKQLILSVHSQGTVLTVAAIAPLKAEMPRISLVTYGSPLGGLYRVCFPAYFGRDFLMNNVKSNVKDWTNFRRRTDAIASDIDGVDTVWLKSPGVSLPRDFPALPLTTGTLQPPETPAERDRQPWIKVEAHSNYRSEPVMKRYIDRLRRASN